MGSLTVTRSFLQSALLHILRHIQNLHFQLRLQRVWDSTACSLRSHKSSVEPLYVQFIDIELELRSDSAGIRRSGAAESYFADLVFRDIEQ